MTWMTSNLTVMQNLERQPKGQSLRKAAAPRDG